MVIHSLLAFIDWLQLIIPRFLDFCLLRTDILQFECPYPLTLEWMKFDLWHIDHNATGSISYVPWKWITTWPQKCYNCCRGTQRSTQCDFGAIIWPYEKKSVDKFAVVWWCIPEARKKNLHTCLFFIRFTKHQNCSCHSDTPTVHWHKCPHRSLATMNPSVKDALGILVESFHAWWDRYWPRHYLQY